MTKPVSIGRFFSSSSKRVRKVLEQSVSSLRASQVSETRQRGLWELRKSRLGVNLPSRDECVLLLLLCLPFLNTPSSCLFSGNEAQFPPRQDCSVEEVRENPRSPSSPSCSSLARSATQPFVRKMEPQRPFPTFGSSSFPSTPPPRKGRLPTGLPASLPLSPNSTASSGSSRSLNQVAVTLSALLLQTPATPPTILSS